MSNGTSTPTPDPTVLTTEQLERAIKQLEGQLGALKEFFLAQIEALRRELELIERHRVEQKADTKTAVDDTLAAQKELYADQRKASQDAIDKSELAISRQISQLETTFTTAVSGLVTSIDDLKERVSRNESRIDVEVAEKRGGREQWGLTQSIVAAIVAIGAIIATIVGLAVAFQ